MTVFKRSLVAVLATTTLLTATSEDLFDDFQSGPPLNVPSVQGMSVWHAAGLTASSPDRPDLVPTTYGQGTGKIVNGSIDSPMAGRVIITIKQRPNVQMTMRPTEQETGIPGPGCIADPEDFDWQFGVSDEDEAGLPMDWEYSARAPGRMRFPIPIAGGRVVPYKEDASTVRGRPNIRGEQMTDEEIIDWMEDAW